jgi:hypothetical protein
LLLTLPACDTISYESLPTIRPDPVYDALYPYYVEICAVSQIRATFAEHGGSPGHAAMYLKGVCRDPDAEFPTIKVCEPGSVDLTDAEAGVGISVNKIFKSVNWMVIPGKRLFFYGNLDGDEVLDEQHVRETIQAAADQELFKGIKIHEQYMPPEGDEEALLQFLAKETLGTDFALTYGRTIFCARLPVTRDMMEKIVAYLNGLNREYALGEADYNWSGYHDNCSHTIHNALAAAAVWPFKRVQSFKVRQFFNLSVPANEFAELAILTNTFSIENFNRIYRDKVKRKSLLEHNWLPARHGALLKLIPVHQNNKLYDTLVRIFMLQNPLLKPKSRTIGELYSDPRHTELEADLLSFKERYEAILEKRTAPWNEVQAKSEYEKARTAYYAYIKQQLADVNNKLMLLGTLRKQEE